MKRAAEMKWLRKIPKENINLETFIVLLNLQGISTIDPSNKQLLHIQYSQGIRARGRGRNTHSLISQELALSYDPIEAYTELLTFKNFYSPERTDGKKTLPTM